MNNNYLKDTIVFIDGPNVGKTIENLNRLRNRDEKLFMDYERFMEYLKLHWNVYQVRFYTAFDPKNEKQLGFLDLMERFCYIVVKKEIETLHDGSRKGDIDPEIITDLIDIPKKFTECRNIVLVSGDGDFTTPIKRMSDKGYRTIVIACRDSRWRNIGRTLMRVCDEFIDLEEILEEMKRESIRKAEGKLQFFRQYN